MPLNRFRIPGPLGLNLGPGHDSHSGYLERVLASLGARKGGEPSRPGPAALSGQQVLQLVGNLGKRPSSPAKPQAVAVAPRSSLADAAPSKAKGTVGDNPNAPQPPFNSALLDAAIRAGIRVRYYKRGEPKDKPGAELKLPSTSAAAVGVAAAVVPILPPPAQLPGPVPSGPMNVPGIRPDAFRWPFIEPTPPPATAPGAGGTSALRFPGPLGIVTAGAVILFFGALIPSDSGIKQIDKSKIGTLLDRLAAIVREEEERLNRETFNGDWSGVAGMNPNLWKRIEELSKKDPNDPSKGRDPWTAFKLLKIAFGRTIEERVAFRIDADPDLTDAIDRAGGANRPDFTGYPLGPLEGFTFDITTEEDLQPHLDRKERPEYGRFLIVYTYDRWFKDSL